ncbi:MAG: winged helix DNA-binding protein [Alphaproteobacteria bacterium]|nr:winged helix DNA-binding protein [Alphaproteobacteria bacterium]MBV8410198.1 winged helix DNA-binding protein [Alphaproteobacteria bacterium]
MRTLKIHVGDSLETIGKRVKDAVRRDRRGERVREHHVTFDSFETLAKVLTPRRLELLRHVHRHPAASIRALAQALGRDYRRVHEDVEALTAAGLLERPPKGTEVTAPFDTIEARVAL